MRILYTLNSGQPGGMERHVLDLVRGMKDKDHEVYVWCNEGPIADWYRNAGAKVHIKKVNVTFGIDIDPSYIISLISFLRQKKINVLHSHELRAVGNSLIAGFLSGTKVNISHIHTPFSEWPIPTWKKRLYTLSYSIATWLLTDKEIALTESRKRVKVKEGIRPDRLHIIPNAVDLTKFTLSKEERDQYKTEIMDRYQISKQKFIVGNVSRLTEEKAHEILIKAFARLFEYKEVSKRDVHLLIAGGGVLEDKIKALVGELDLKNNVTITGRFLDDDLVKLYATFDAFVFPSLAEGFGIVLVEAMAMGLPVISSNLEVLEEVGGSSVFTYFEVGDFENLAQKMHDLYLKREILQNTKSNAKERVQKLYSLEKFTDAYEALYTEILERK